MSNKYNIHNRTAAASELQRLRQQYAQLKRSNYSISASVAHSLREIRLKQLFATIRAIFAQKRQPSPKPKPKTPQQLRQERLHYARKRGNEFSKIAKQRIIEDQLLAPPWSFNFFDHGSFKAITYGNYYSARNRLLQKDLAGQYDHEFHALLLKCAIFEQQHADVRGFLDKNILCGTGYSLATREGPSKFEASYVSKSNYSSSSTESHHNEDPGQPLEEVASKGTVIWSHADTYMGKVSSVDSDVEIPTEGYDGAADVERIGDQ